MGFSMQRNAEITVVWKFSNGHAWSKDFPNENEAYHFIQVCDLVGHPHSTVVGTIQHTYAGTRTHYLKGGEHYA
jgi:hypothetical protein